jgi:membrane-bound ClpP family serine protease
MIHIKQCMHSKDPDTCMRIPTDKAGQVTSAVDYIADLVGTTGSSIVKTCGSESTHTAAQSNVPHEMVKSESRESAQVHSGQIIADQQSVTTCDSAVKHECTLTFNAVDVPDSKISILLQSHDGAQSKVSNFKTRSKSVETAANEVHINVLSTISAPSLL